MRWIFILVLPVTVGVILLPMLWLPDSGEKARYEAEGLMVRYDSYLSAVKSVDSATCTDQMSGIIQGNFYEGLYTYHYLKRPPEVIPLLAEAMPETADCMTYTIRIKPGVKFQRNPCFGTNADGTYKTRTVTAEDFVYAFKRVADYHVQAYLAWPLIKGRIAGLDEYHQKTKEYPAGDFSRYALDVEGIKAIDELTLEIRLAAPFPQLIYLLALHNYAPIPFEAVDYWLASEDDGFGGRMSVPMVQRTTEFREAEQVVGTGPFLLTTYERKSQIIMERNPDFRPDFYPTEGAPGDAEAGLLDDAGKQVPFVDVLHYSYVSEFFSSWMLFLSRQTDVAPIPKETFSQVISPDKTLEEKWAKKHIKLFKYTVPSVYWIVFNMEDPIFAASKSLRQGLCLGFDVESYLDVIFNGRGIRPVNIVPSTFKGHAEAGPGPYFRYDIEAAKVKLARAREELAAADLLDNGEIPTLRLDVGSGDTATITRTEFMKQQFAKVGIELKITYNDWPTLQQKVDNKQTQMYTMGWGADYPDAENFLQLYYTGNIAAGTNNSNYSNPEFDKLYEQIRTMDDTPERTAIYAKLIQMISEDCPILPLDEPTVFVLYYEWAKNIKQPPFGAGFRKYTRIDMDLREKVTGRR